MASSHSALQEALDLIGALLPDDEQWHPARPIYTAAREAGISEATLRRAARELGVEHQRLRQPRAPVQWRVAQLVEQVDLRSAVIKRHAA